MPWFFPWPDYIKKKACRYLLQHYVGSFLEEKLTLEQLSVDLYNGTGTVTDVRLDVWALNELLNNSNAPVEIRNGIIGSITVSIPWKALLTANSQVEVKGLTITLQPKYRSETDAAFGNTVNSMWSSMSMTSSMQLAQECWKQDPSEGEQHAENTQPLEGLEMFAQTIESVLTRVEVSLTDTCVRLEHLPLGSSTGIAAEIRIQKINYFDDVAKDITDQGSSVDPAMPKRFEPAAVAVKNLQMFGLAVHCEEFSEEIREPSWRTNESVQPPTPDSSPPFKSLATSPPMPPQHQQIHRGITVKQPKRAKLMLESALIGSCTGKQELKIKIKQNEALSGPKAEVDCFLGSMNWFLSPKQVTFLTEFVSGFSTPASSSTNVQNKPMEYEDYRKVETALQDQITPNYTERIRRESWGIDDGSHFLMGQSLVSETSEMFLSMTQTAMSLSTQSLDMESSFSSNVSATSTDTSKTGCSSLARLGYGGPYYRPQPAHLYGSVSSKGKRKKRMSGEYGSDPTSEVTHYKLRFASMSVTILHEDPTPIQAIEKLGNTKLQEMSQHFFDELQAGYGVKDSAEWKRRFAVACPYDHLRFVAAPCNLELQRKEIGFFTQNTAEISLGTLQILECLFNKNKAASSLDASMNGSASLQPEHTEILTFDELPPVGNVYSAFTGKSNSAVHVKIESKDRTDNTIGHRASKQKMKIEVELGQLTCEIDVTIVDRLYSLLHPQEFSDIKQGGQMSFKSMYASTNMKQACFKQALDDDTTNSAYHIDIDVTCPQATLNLRFPCPDFRPPTDIERSPWWKKSVRQEILSMELLDVDFSTKLNSDVFEKKCIVRSRQVDAKFKMSADDVPVSFLKVTGVKSVDQVENKEFDWPRLVIMIRPPNQTSVFDQEQECSPETTPVNSFESLYFQKPEPSSPFSSRNVMYENDQMVIPGDDDEMREFIETSNQDSQLLIEINLPVINLLIPTNEFLNNVYNRFCTDLLLWQPTAPTPTETCKDVFQSAMWDLGSPLTSYPDTTQPFKMCHSMKSHDCYSDEDEEDDIFQTMHDASLRRKLRQQQRPKDYSNYLALTLTVGHGRLTLHIPSEVEEMNNFHSEVMFEIEEGNLFVVNEYKGDKDLAYVCVQGKRYVLYHAAEVENSPLQPSLEPLSCMVPRHLKKCLHLSDDGVPQSHNDNKNTNMLAVAVKLTVEPDKNVKSIVCSVSARTTTLCHFVTKPEHSWMAQVGAMFDLLDDTVPGYTFPRVVTELHVHFWECGIDYRPIHLPISTFISLNSFSISSTLVYEAKQSLLKFIVDDAALFLSDKCNGGVVDLRKNYVCVMELGSFELSLKINADKEKTPHLELTASNNVFIIKTCSDSFSAILKLILYLANSGDLNEPVQLQQSDTQEPVSIGKTANIGDKSPVCQANHYDKMHDMMADAMKEVNATSDMHSTKQERTNTNVEDSSIELYLFPDENNLTQSVPHGHVDNGNQVTDVRRQTGDNSDLFDDDEFCILDDPGTGFRPRNNEPEVKVRTCKPIKVINDHFKRPLEKADQLKSPDTFPAALKRFTLKEMTIIWQMYGGKDFAAVSKGKTFESSSSLNDKTSSSPHGRNLSASPSCARNPSKTNSKWYLQGDRDQDVLMELQLNKVRFQHDEYVRSTETKQCSRQILLINDIEIRDRLVHSQINKFLYQYSSASRPKQTHANMVLIKAVHLQPDPALSAEECCLKISLQPLRLNIDQDALFFLRDFFTNVSTDVNRMNFPIELETEPSNSANTTSIRVDSEASDSSDSESLLTSKISSTSSSTENSDVSDTTSIQPIFFRSLEFSPAVPIRLDYQGKRVTMEQGTFIGILVGLAQLNCSELTLKRIHYRHGLLGVDKLVLHMINEWAHDIKKTQLPSILGGVGPMHSFVQLVQGIVDLVRMPIEQYKKDGRIMRGLQRGANSFGTSTAMAAVELTNKCVQALQSVAEMTYDMVSPGPSVVSHRAITVNNGTQYRMAKQPADLREGVTNAMNVVRQGLENTASTLVQVAKEEHSHKGVSGAVGGVLRQVPPTMIKPLILATEATSNVLGGMRNQMQPDARKEDAEKWKTQATT